MTIEATNLPDSWVLPATPAERPREFLQAHELAALLGVSLRSIDRWEADGVIPKPGIRSGRIRIWRRSDIEKLFDRAARRG